MANIKDNLNLLATEVGIAPAGSQEELDSARTLSEAFSSRGLDSRVEEFSVSALGTLPRAVLGILLFVGILFSGIGGALGVIGLIVALASAVLLLMAFGGNDVLSKLGPKAHSQNVIAVRKATAEGASKNRPVVILAHYDTGRVDLLAKPGLSVAKRYLAQAAPYVAAAVAICAFLQILVFLPAGLRRAVWVIGIIASLPALAQGISGVASRFLPFLPGAVDNKSSVAAMLGIADNVCSGEDVPRSREDEEPAESSADEPASVRDSIVAPAQHPSEPELRREVEKVVGVRHGEHVLRALGILPASCEITYIEPEVRMVPIDAPAASGRGGSSSETRDLTLSDAAERSDAQSSDASDPDATRPLDIAEDASSTHPMAPVDDDGRIDVGEVHADDTAVEPVAVNAPARQAAKAVSGVGEFFKETFVSMRERMSKLENGQRTDEGPVVETEQEGLTTMVEEDSETAASAPRAARPAPAAVDDPQWGKSSFTPEGSNHLAPGRRAALFDLPDPLAEQDASSDPFATPSQEPAPSPAPQPTSPATSPQPSEPASTPMAQRLSEASHQAQAMPSVRIDDEQPPVVGVPVTSDAVIPPVSDIEVLSADNTHDPKAQAKGHRRGLFGRKHRQDPGSMSAWLGVDEDYDAKESGEQIGSWNNFDSEGSSKRHWKGGAARSQETRGAGQDEAELRDAVLSMDDDALAAHDVWFVATGASAYDHAGARHFVEQNKKALRGAFIVNLECVGAGRLTALTREGAGNVRRADRRIVRLLTGVAKDLHVTLGQADRSWADTEATCAMRSSMRAVTLMGMGDNDLPAFSGTEGDVEENVDAAQVSDVASIVTELIRRA